MEPKKTQMHRGLTKSDKKILRNQCKMGLSLSLLVFIFATIIGITMYELIFDTNPGGLNGKMAVSIAIGALICSVLLNFLINHKYYRDLQFNEKTQIIRTLVSKSERKDYHAASPRSGMSKAYNEIYEFIVDDVKFDVDKELFERCSEGDKLILNYALKSQYLLSIEKQ
ncbi:hypothetical protein [uncultured Draconibacterium sp.]|uniref:hypothetical protein n=1 Tax=uncultured Draconibacterium sp. TaxID=1573823 RepID=UPI0029C95A9E|nr:hypothetical protein [uncultured Draconibacterium sp.]